FHVTGVQTCALPIYRKQLTNPVPQIKKMEQKEVYPNFPTNYSAIETEKELKKIQEKSSDSNLYESESDTLSDNERIPPLVTVNRSEERRVGKKWTSK